MKKRRPKREFYVLTNSMPQASGRKGKPWLIDVETSRDEYSKIIRGLPLDPGSRFAGEVDDCSRREDFPMDGIGHFIVSGRAREVIESVAPGNCLFFPVQLTCHGARIADQYWLLNCTCVISHDAIDPVASAPWRIESGRVPQEYIRVELDRTRVPASAKFFKVQEFSIYPFIREEVRTAFVAAGLTGWVAWQG